MFTGLIEKIGKLKAKTSKNNMVSLLIDVDDMWNDVVLGESIAVDGVCLTVTAFNTDSFSADVSLPTLNSTNLGAISLGSSIHLERALRVGDRFGGHIVQGHVDAQGSLLEISRNSENVFMTVEVSKDVIDYLVDKGSVAVNGVSLTIQRLTDDSFTVVLIPHTFDKTVFKHMKSGSKVNIEIDIFAKYVKRFTSNSNLPELTEDFLRQNGF